MKKLIATIATFVMLAVGFVALSGNVTATAGTGCYPGTVASKTSASGPTKVKKGKTEATKVKVTGATDSIAGTVKVTWSGKGLSKTVSAKYTGGSKTFTSPKLKKPGKYKAVAKFSPTGSCNVLKGSSDSYTFKVK